MLPAGHELVAPCVAFAIEATARREFERTQGTCTRIRPAASDTTRMSVLVVVFADGRRLRLLTDAFAGFGHHVGHLQPG